MFSLFATKSNSTYNKLAYEFSFKDLDGTELKLSEFKNNVIVVTNVASRCGFTSQYEDLEFMGKLSGKGLVVIGIPSNSLIKNLI